MKLDPTKLQVNPEYIRGLIEQSARTQRGAAIAIGVAPRTLADWLNGKAKWSYPAQYALECLVQYGVVK